MTSSKKGNLGGLKVALVHDFLTQAGGAERVLDVLHAMWPTAPIYTLVYRPEVFGTRYAGAAIHPSFIQRLPGGATRYKWYLPLMPRAIESFDLSGFDLVISDASAFAKGVKVPAHIPHICYLHSPTRYLWSDRASYLKTAPVPGLFRPLLQGMILPKLAKWDLTAAKRPWAYIANSELVAKRLKTYYHRTAEAVIFPPVDTERFTIRSTTKDYWFTAARFEPYKRLDLILDAFAEIGWPLKVAGTGSRIADLAHWTRFPNIEFVGRVTDAKLATLYGEAKAFVFAANEDAGIAPLEAMAAGRPVLAYGAGGSLESIVVGVTGEFFQEQTVASLVAALKKFKPEQYDPREIRAHAEHFDVRTFTDTIEQVITTILSKKEQHGTS